MIFDTCAVCFVNNLHDHLYKKYPIGSNALWEYTRIFSYDSYQVIEVKVGNYPRNKTLPLSR